MNQNELEKHLFFQIFFIVFVVVCMIFTLIYLLTTDVKAKQQTSTVNSSIYTDYNGDCTGGQSGYCILQTNGIAYKRSLNTTYNGVLNAISFELHYVMNPNYQYTLNINGMSTDFRNNSLSVYVCGYNGSNNYNTCSQHPISVSFRFVSKSQLQIVFPVQTYETYKIEIVGSPLTGISTYGIKNMILVYDDNQADMSGVIENNNQNTTSIIDNNNSNTQDIIESNVLNFTNLIEKNKDNFLASLNQERTQLVKMCSNAYDTPLKLGKTLSTSDGSLIDKENSYYTEDYVNIDFITGSKTRLYIENPPNSVPGYILVAYDTNKQYLGRVNTATRSWAFPSGTQYFRFSSPVPNTLITANTKCVRSEDAINDYLKDDTNPNIDDSAISDTLESVAVDDPLNYLLTLPLHTIQRINYQLGRNTCSQINLGSLYGTDLILPCINIEQKIGSSLFATIDILMAIGIGSVTLKKFYDSVSNVLTLGKEKEVREKLELPTPMEFFAMIFGGGR